jgi:hypothetical protein
LSSLTVDSDTDYYLKDNLRLFCNHPRESDSDHVPERLESASRVVGDQDSPTDRQNSASASHWPTGVLQRDDFKRPGGGDEQQDQNKDAAGVWISRHGVLQALNLGGSQEEILPNRVNYSSGPLGRAERHVPLLTVDDQFQTVSDQGPQAQSG